MVQSGQSLLGWAMLLALGFKLKIFTTPAFSCFFETCIDRDSVLATLEELESPSSCFLRELLHTEYGRPIVAVHALNRICVQTQLGVEKFG